MQLLDIVTVYVDSNCKIFTYTVAEETKPVFK